MRRHPLGVPFSVIGVLRLFCIAVGAVAVLAELHVMAIGALSQADFLSRGGLLSQFLRTRVGLGRLAGLDSQPTGVSAFGIVGTTDEGAESPELEAETTRAADGADTR